VYVIYGRGGNIGVSAGADGVFLIDDQYAPLTPKIKAELAKLSAAPVRFIINTHWHSDHTGGNEALAGEGALVLAHDNVRQRMSVEQFMAFFERTVPPSPPAALPVVTFNDTVTFHLNGDEIHVFHMPGAHTDGDALVHFRRANVIHMGDTLFYGLYPFIDVDSGGSIAGTIAAVDAALALADEKTRIVPGHGNSVTDKAGLTAYRDMLVTVRGRIAGLVAEGKTLEEVQAAAPTAEYDAEWGQGFIKPDRWVALIYKDLSR
jgi:glyoxylase-like metal-dependent hydrolase (beta-lactamase superfamily II)